MFQLYLGCDMIYEITLTTQGIFSLPHHIGFIWEKLAFDNTVAIDSGEMDYSTAKCYNHDRDSYPCPQDYNWANSPHSYWRNWARVTLLLVTCQHTRCQLEDLLSNLWTWLGCWVYFVLTTCKVIPGPCWQWLCRDALCGLQSKKEGHRKIDKTFTK